VSKDTDLRSRGMSFNKVLTFATQKLKASIGFHDMAFEDMLSTVFDIGDEVRKSKWMTERSVAHEARIDVST